MFQIVHSAPSWGSLSQLSLCREDSCPVEMFRSIVINICSMKLLIFRGCLLPQPILTYPD